MKKKLRFKVKTRGYDTKAVDDFIESEQVRTDEIMLARQSRIAELASECDRLKRELSAMKAREGQIKSAILTATQNADKLTADVKARCSEEIERIRLFRAKWTGAYEQLKERYHFDKDALNMESVAVSVEIELGKMLAQDFSLGKGPSDEMEEYFRSEVERLTAKGPKREEENAAFSLEEALRPTESLEELCHQLGCK